MSVDCFCLPAGKNASGQIKAVSEVMKKTPKKYQSIYIYLILALTTTAVFYQVCTYDFINFDDTTYIYENPNIQNGITPKAIKWAFTTGYASNWHPLTWLSYMLDWQLYGPEPAGYHITNLIFHIANTLLLFIVLKQMTHKLWPSAFVAALFALHPLHVESVAWVSERKDVLSTFFWMLTMWAYVRFVNRPKIASYLLVIVFFALGLMSKPMLVTLPFVLLLLDYWPLDRFSPKRGKAGSKYSLPYLLVEKALLFAMTLTSCIVTFIVQKKGGAMEWENYSLPVRLANAFISYMQYIIKMVWPSRLAVFYPHPNQNVSILYAVISAVFLLVVTILIFRFAKNHRYLLTGWFWYLGTLVPVIGLIQVGAQAIAYRYTYITLTGLFIIIAWGLPDLLAKWQYKKIALTLSALLIIIAISVCAHFQLRYWQNSLTLFQHDLNVTRDNYVAHFCVAGPLREQGKLNETIYHCSEAIRIKPKYTKALNCLGIALCEAGRIDEAIPYYKKAVEIDPHFDDANINLALALAAKGDSAATHINTGHALALQGKLDEAAVHLTEALWLDPQSAQAHYYLGQVLVQIGKIGKALTHFEKALRLKPDWIEPMNNLAWLLAASKETTIHNPDKAIRLVRRACELANYKEPVLLDTLAVAYAAKGDFSKAIETAEKALELCQSSEQKTLKKEIESRLALYKAGKPYIETH
jgi:tetratricopeptide (TPR) repeat protein